MRKCIVMMFLLASPILCAAQANKTASKPKAKSKVANNKYVLLSDVVKQVELALDAYKQDPDVTEKKVLPDLASAEFDFKTVVDIKSGFGISFLIFKIGYSHDKQTTNDVNFHYEPKPLPEGLDTHKAESFQKQLIDTIKAAANAVKEQQTSADKDLVFKQLTVTVSFGVTNDVNGGGSGPLSITTLSGTLEGSKNAVQQVKLTFGKPSKPTGM